VEKRGIRPEILAPAGSWETLRAAAAAGADAVYFGGQSFNARRNAANFTDGELPEAVSYCHARGMKAYLTLNTLVFEDELAAALDFAAKAAATGADALIVQDPGLALRIRKAAPSLRLNASTQMSVHSLSGVEELARMGFTRVVLARELSYRELRGIVAHSPIELEVFVHGALCMSVSGQCYLSAMLGGRSGNRGLCAQPCRLPFAAPGGTGHDLSLKDLSLIGRMAELKELGVASLKIEGRMKRPEYVAAATDLCRRAAEGQPVTKEELEGLRAVFSRSGFTQGYFDGRLGREMFGSRGREDVAAMQAALGRYRGLAAGGERARVGVSFTFSCKAGGPCRLTARDGAGNEAAAEGMTPQAALHRPLDEETVARQLAKTGGTPFFAAETRMALGKGLSLPAAELNRLRRQALEELLRLRGRSRPIPFDRAAAESTGFSTVSAAFVENPASSAFVLQLRGFSQLTPEAMRTAAGMGIVYLPARAIARESSKARTALVAGVRLGAALPRLLFGAESERELREALRSAAALGVRDALCDNLGALPLAREAGLRIHGGFGLNCANASAPAAFPAPGPVDFVASFEATLPRIRRTAQKVPVPAGVLVYGYLPLMLTRNCPLKNGAGCARCAGALTDRRNEHFPVVCGEGGSELLNSRPLWMLDRLGEVFSAGARYAFLRFTVESPGRVEEILRMCARGCKDAPPPEPFTRGLYIRGVE
jgi:putative protease